MEEGVEPPATESALEEEGDAGQDGAAGEDNSAVEETSHDSSGRSEQLIFDIESKKDGQRMIGLLITKLKEMNSFLAGLVTYWDNEAGGETEADDGTEGTEEEEVAEEVDAGEEVDEAEESEAEAPADDQEEEEEEPPEDASSARRRRRRRYRM